MNTLRLGNAMGSVIRCFVFGIAVLGVVACGGRGNTDGGSAVDNDAGLGSQFVADGGAGATLKISLTSPRIPVGDERGFFVTATDPNGAPLEFIRIFCSAEPGIGIVFPESGFEFTGADGRMSGVVEMLDPGSFVLQCEGPLGFGLVDRVTLVGLE